MGYNGSGTFELTDGVRTEPGVCVAQEAASTGIDSSLFDYMLEDMTTGLSTCITKDGQTTISANIPFNNKLITGLGDAVNLSDAANAQFVQDGSSTWLGSTSGSSNAYTASGNPTIAAYATGQRFAFEANHTNDGAATLNIDGKGVKNIRKGNGATALAANDIISGIVYEVCYDGTQFVVLGGSADIIGTTNEIEVTKSTSGIQIGLPDDVTIGNDLTITRYGIIDEIRPSGDELTLRADLLRTDDYLTIGSDGAVFGLKVKANDVDIWQFRGSGDLHPLNAEHAIGRDVANETISKIWFTDDDSPIACRSYGTTWTSWQSGTASRIYSLDESALTNADAIAVAKVVNTLIEDLQNFGILAGGTGL